MTGATSPTQLSAAQVRAIRRAAQRQLTRWAKLQADDETRRRSTELREALHTLRMFRDGCELRPIDDPQRRDDPP
jgi:hypothetical protein